MRYLGEDENSPVVELELTSATQMCTQMSNCIAVSCTIGSERGCFLNLVEDGNAPPDGWFVNDEETSLGIGLPIKGDGASSTTCYAKTFIHYPGMNYF